MTISKTGSAAFQVAGSSNTLNLRWSKVNGRGTDDNITLSKKNIGGWGYINMGGGTDVVTLGAAGDYTLQLVGVETIKTTQDLTTLTLRSDATTATDGSFTSITAGYGVQNITFTTATRDNTVSLGDLSDKVTLTSASWVYNKSGTSVVAYDTASSYKVTLASDVETLNVASTDISTSGMTDTVLVLPSSGSVDISTITLVTVDSVSFNDGGNSLTLTDAQVADIATFTGGAGTDQITLSAAGSIDLTSVTTTSIDSINGSSGADTIVGNSAANVINGLGDNDTITAAGGADTIAGGDGSDTFVYKLTADLFSSQAVVDSLTGGDGTDVLLVGTVGTAFAIANNDLWTRASTVETIKSVANTSAVTIRLDVTAEVAGVRTVDLSDAITSTGNIVDVSEFVTAGVTIIGGAAATTLTGGGGADSITGGAGADTITGGAGNDTLTGSGGIDSINGGAGQDSIVLTETSAVADTVLVNFASAATPTTESSTTAYDSVTAFAKATDKLKFVDTDTSAVTIAIGADDASGAITLNTVDVLVLNGAMTGITKGTGTAATALTIGTSSDVDSLSKVVALINTDYPTDGNTIVFAYGADTYQFVQNGTADVLVKLVAVSSIAAASVSSGVITLS